MKKSKGIISLILIVVLIGLLGFTTAVGFGKGGSGAARNIKLGLDLEGGVSITYQVKGGTPSAEDMADTIYKLQRRVEQYSTEATVYQEGDDRISIEIPGVTNANEILDELGQPGSLYFISETDSEGEENYTYKDGKYVLNKTIEELDMETLKTFSKLFTDDIYKAINPTASVNSKKALGGPSVGNTVQVIKINEEWVKDKKNQLEKM